VFFPEDYSLNNPIYVHFGLTEAKIYKKFYFSGKWANFFDPKLICSLFLIFSLLFLHVSFKSIKQRSAKFVNFRKNVSTSAFLRHNKD